LEPAGKFYCEIRAFTDLACRVIILISGQARFFERLEQPVQILRQELLAKGWIDPCSHKLILGDRVALALAFE
jgi:hypothetical protein